MGFEKYKDLEKDTDKIELNKLNNKNWYHENDDDNCYDWTIQSYN